MDKAISQQENSKAPEVNSVRPSGKKENLSTALKQNLLRRKTAKKRKIENK